MKFQKGILSDDEEPRQRLEIREEGPRAPVRPSTPAQRPVILGDVEKSHLFETQEEFAGSSRNYLKLFAIVVGVIIIGGVAIFYFTLPGVGDQVRAPRGLEDAMRDHFLMKQKRTATDITFYQCDNYFWARVGVETRPDIRTDPIYQIAKYVARAAATGGDAWDINAAPVTSPSMDVPCS